MVDVVEQMFVMLMVKAVAPGRFELLRVSERGVSLLDWFEPADEAITRWNAMEHAVRQQGGCAGGNGLPLSLAAVQSTFAVGA